MKNEIEKYDPMPNEKPKRFGKGAKILVGGLVLSTLGFGIWKYFDWRSKQSAYQKKGDQNEGNENNILPSPELVENNIPAKPSVPKQTNNYTQSPASDFPIKRGSRGTKVKQLQNALIQKFGSSLMPKYGADGQFGSEMENALRAKGIPTVITEEQFWVLTQVDNSDVATKLYNAAKNNDYPAAISAVKTIRNVSDYKAVSEKFKAMRLNGVSTTLVTGLLNKFTNPTYKQQLQLEFSRMGLVFDGNKWTAPEGVAGIDNRQVCTVRPTQVWQDAKYTLDVDKGVILGREIYSANGFTHFDTVDGFRLYVLTAHIRYC